MIDFTVVCPGCGEKRFVTKSYYNLMKYKGVPRCKTCMGKVRSALNKRIRKMKLVDSFQMNDCIVIKGEEFDRCDLYDDCKNYPECLRAVSEYNWDGWTNKR